MHVLITGGSGFIGRALCNELRRHGATATVLSRRPERVRLPSGARAVGSLDELPPVDAVVNLAGETLAGGRWTAARKQAFRDSRLDTTRQLVDWLAARPAAQRPKVLVSASAIGYYGPGGEQPLDESAPAGEGFAAGLCRDWEAAALRAEGLGLRVCRLRIGIVLGHSGGALGRMLPLFRLGLGGRLGDGQQWMSWIRRNDLVRMIVWLLNTPTTRGVYNGTAPVPVRNAEFTGTLAAALRRPALLPVPAPLLRLAMGEMAELLLQGHPVLPKLALAEGFEFHAPQLTVAFDELLRGQR